jgi:PAS domain S-box-containing protein
VDRYRHPTGKIKFQYTLVTEDSVTEGNQIMARWSMETLNARQCGARTELHQQGMLLSKFNSAHKIVSIEIMVSFTSCRSAYEEFKLSYCSSSSFQFDVMAFMLQVKMAMGFENFNDVAIPNTVQTCQKQYDYPMVMTLADRPYTIVQINEEWENLTGYKSAEVVGKCSCSILQGADTTQKELSQLMSPVLFKRPSCGMLTNYTKSGRRYRTYITLYPLSTDSTVSHYFGLTTFVQWIDAAEEMPDNQQSHNKGEQEASTASSKRPRENSASGSTGSEKSKHAKINEKTSCMNAAVKVVAASNRDKQSLSSLTSSMSSSSTVDKEGGNDANDHNECDSVAVLVPSRAK